MVKSSPLRIVLPAHHEGQLLEYAIKSIQEQRFTDWRMSLVLDSADMVTTRIAWQHSDKDPRIEVSEVSLGNLGAVLQYVTSCVSEKYIARMDADDVALPGRIERQIHYLEKNQDVAAVGTNVVFCDASGMPFGKSNNNLNHHEIYEELLTGRGSAIFHPTAVFRTECLLRTEGYSSKLARGQDLDVYLKLSEVGKLANLRDALLRFRKHDASSTAGEDVDEALSRRVSTIESHYARIGCVDTVGEVIRIRNIPADEEIIRRLRSALAHRFYYTAVVYAGHVARDPKARHALWEKIWTRLRNGVKGYVLQSVKLFRRE